MARVLINVPPKAKRGEVIQIKTLISHVMETGYRHSNIGVPIPRRVKGRVRVWPKALCRFVTSLDSGGRHRWGPIAPCSRIEVELLERFVDGNADGVRRFWCGDDAFRPRELHRGLEGFELLDRFVVAEMRGRD